MTSASLPTGSRHTPGGIPELLALAVPMMISNACETFMMFTDRLFLSRLGPEIMSASMGGGVSCFMFMTFFMGLIGYSNALVAQHLGAGQRERCGTVTAQAMMVAVAAFPLILLCIPLGEVMFRAARIPAEQLAPQLDYFRLCMYGTVLGLLRNALASFFSGIGRTRVVMLSTVMAMLVNVFCNWVLIFGRFGVPALGIRGAAIGTIIGSASGLAMLSLCYFSKANRREFGVLSGLRLDRALFTKLLRLGSPAGLEFFLGIMAFNLLITSFHSYGVDVAAAVTITFNWDMIAILPLIGLEIGITSLVGRYMGAREPDTAHRVTMSGLKLALLYMGGMFTVFLLFPEPLVNIFRPDDPAAPFADVANLAIYMIRLITVYLFAIALSIVFCGALRGAGDTFWTMVISVVWHWIMGLIAAACVYWLKLDPRTTWLIVVCSVVVHGCIFAFRYRAGGWRKLKVIDNEGEPAQDAAAESDDDGNATDAEPQPALTPGN